MKEIKLYIGIIAVLLTAMLTGCSDSIADSEPSKDICLNFVYYISTYHSL